MRNISRVTLRSVSYTHLQAHAGETYYDCTGNRTEEVTVGEDGTGDFSVNGGSASVWIKKKEGENAV